MRILARYAFSIGGAAALLVGCGGGQPPIDASGAVPQSRAIAMQAALQLVSPTYCGPTLGNCLRINPTHLVFASTKSPRQYFNIGPEFSRHPSLWCSPSWPCFGTCPSAYMVKYGGFAGHKKGTKWHLWVIPSGGRTGKCYYIFTNYMGTKTATLYITVK